MTTETEALRERFEWAFQLFEPSRIRIAWIAYQQGYAAATAETADTSDGRWRALVKLANGDIK